MAIQHPAFLRCLSVVDKASVGNNTMGKSVVDGMDRGSMDSMSNRVGNHRGGMDSVGNDGGSVDSVGNGVGSVGN